MVAAVAVAEARLAVKANPHKILSLLRSESEDDGENYKSNKELTAARFI